MNELRDYYQNLYSEQDSDLNEDMCPTFLDNNNIPILTEESIMACEGKLSLVECYEVLQMLSSGKARVCLMCEPASHASYNASQASQGASHASHRFNAKKNQRMNIFI